MQPSKKRRRLMMEKIQDVKVKYKGRNKEFDVEVDALMEKWGLQRWASGGDVGGGGRRDLAYDTSDNLKESNAKK